MRFLKRQKKATSWRPKRRRSEEDQMSRVGPPLACRPAEEGQLSGWDGTLNLPRRDVWRPTVWLPFRRRSEARSGNTKALFFSQLCSGFSSPMFEVL